MVSRYSAVGLVGLTALVVLGGCEDDFSLGRTRQVDTFTQAPAVKADVLFVVDNSSSMRSSQAKIVAAFEDFAAGLEAIESDFHIGVTTTDVSAEGARGAMIPVYDPSSGQEYAYISPDLPNYTQRFEEAVANVGTSGSSFEAGLESAARALLTTEEGGVGDTANVGFLREDAKLAVVWLSDEDDCSQDGTLPMLEANECYKSEYADSLVPVGEFVEKYLGLKFRDEDVVLGAIVGIANSDLCDGVAVARGDRYITAVEMVGGIVGDICAGDFDTIMEELGVNAAGQRSVFLLSKTPKVDTLEVFVGPTGGELSAQTSGWTYLEDANAVSFYGASIPPRDSDIEIRYEVVSNQGAANP